MGGKESNSKEQRLVQCYFCGNKTLMNIVGKHWNDYDEYADVFEQHLVFSERITWYMLECPACEKVTLLKMLLSNKIPCFLANKIPYFLVSIFHKYLFSVS